MPTPSLCQGRILWLEIADPLGNIKRRPVVIVTPNDQIESATTLAGIICSTTSARVRPRPADYIKIPHDPNRVCRTKLRKPTVAVCRWAVQLSKESLAAVDEDDYGGVAPPRVVQAIIEARIKLAAHEDGTFSA